MAVLVRGGWPVVSVLQLHGQHGLGEVAGSKVQLADPLLDGQGTKDEALDVETIFTGFLLQDKHKNTECITNVGSALVKVMRLLFSSHF